MRNHRANLTHIAFANGEHLLSGWIRHNIRVGFSNFPFDGCLGYWGLPKQHLKAQRIDGAILDGILARTTLEENEREDLLVKRTNYSLWKLGVDSVDNGQKIKSPPAHLEQNTYAFSMSWHLCEQCVREQTEELGFSYWVRRHQIPSVTHCFKHGSILLTHPCVKRLDRLALPAKLLGENEFIPVSQNHSLLEWSNFVIEVDRLIASNPDLITLWQSEVKRILALPEVTRHKDKPFFQALSKRMESDLGDGILNHLFRAYRDERQSKPDVLWRTLSGLRKQKTTRHPVFWLVILYWLRDSLTSLDKI
ncbi:hypothetical protein ACMXYV_07325 [Neptuniibacter sp. SY11_33]|uniref:hypothetical protein n=1 Tax=Neptuniibacter sp. SY11_33 TaxID=3398215 RepID=UPI0039F5B91F